MPFMVDTMRPLAASSPYLSRGTFERDVTPVITSQAYVTLEETAEVVARAVLHPLPDDKDPLKTEVGRRVLTWGMKGKLLFPLPNRTSVRVTKVTYPDLAALAELNDREMRALTNTTDALIAEYNARRGGQYNLRREPRP